MPDAIPLSQPDITDAEIQEVVQTLRSGRLSNGPKVEEFEDLVAQRVVCTNAVAVSSGTAGLHLALAALGVGPGDEVITPAFSFIASANCILHVGATPVFADCNPRTLNVSLDHVERLITERTRAIIGVEVFGNPVGMDELANLANRYEIPLIEDCCEAIGGRYGKRNVGSFGRVGVFGFYPNKQITTGEGGMIVTDDRRLADVCRSMRNQGRDEGGPGAGSLLGSWLSHARLGYNYRMSDLNAALGVAQTGRLDEILEIRQHISEMYTRRLMTNPDLILPAIDSEIEMSWFVYVVRLSDRFTAHDRDDILEGLRRHDVGCSNYFPPIPLQPFYQRQFGYKPGDFPMAESVSHRTIALPFFNRLTEGEVDLVCQTLELMMTRQTFSRS